MQRPSRVLIVEDEAPIRDGLVALFESQGFETTCAASGGEAEKLLAKPSFDVVVLDVMIPAPTGLEVLARFRARDDRTPVLLLTALGAEDDVVRGLEAGADDYMTKPFGVKELVARVRGLLRRSATATRSVEIDGATIDLDRLEVRRGARLVRLTAREADLLAYLMARREKPIARDELLVSVWGYRDGSVQTRTVDVHVQQLRSKLAEVGGKSWINTVRGRGYVFEA